MIAPESRLVLYNGATGGLGRHMAAAADAAGLPSRALAARLEDERALTAELDAVGAPPRVHFVHLAARVSVPACEADPEGARAVNVTWSVAVLERVVAWARGRGSDLAVTYVSTGHVYAPQPVGSRVSEDARTAPRSAYARTKLEAEAVFRERTAASGVRLAIARVFGLLAPGQPAHYVLPGLIARVRGGRLEGIPGLDMVRDYLDARDVCRALLALPGAGLDEEPVVNVCSGEPTSIRDLLRAVLAAVGEPDADARAAAATTAPGRPDDLPWLVGDPARFARLTGLSPMTRTLDDTVRDAVAAMP